MSNAPSCPVVVQAPQASPGKSVGLKPIPAAATLAQVISVANTNFKKLSPDPVSTAIKNTNQAQSRDQAKGDFKEVSRVTKQVKVSNPDDPDQFVMVEQIEGLNFTNPKTGETIVWKR